MKTDPKHTSITREDFVNGAMFDYASRTFRFETKTEMDPNAATGCTWINYGRPIGEFVHMELLDDGVRFWTIESGIWMESKTVVPYSAFKLISTPRTEPTTPAGER